MKQPRRDPVTGDQLTRGEYVSWVVQGIIRRWAFLGVFTLITLIVWLTDNSIALTWWNLGASYLAIVIESIVGISMYSQTRRDAVILRAIERLVKKIEGEEAQEVAELERIENTRLDRPLNTKLQIERAQ